MLKRKKEFTKNGYEEQIIMILHFIYQTEKPPFLIIVKVYRNIDFWFSLFIFCFTLEPLEPLKPLESLKFTTKS